MDDMIRIAVVYDLVVYAPADERKVAANYITNREYSYYAERTDASVFMRSRFAYRHINDAKLTQAWMELRDCCINKKPEKELIEAINKFGARLDKCIQTTGRSIINTVFSTVSKEFREQVVLFPKTISFYKKGSVRPQVEIRKHVFADADDEQMYSIFMTHGTKEELMPYVQKIIDYIYECYPRPLVNFFMYKCNRLVDVISALYYLYN